MAKKKPQLPQLEAADLVVDTVKPKPTWGRPGLDPPHYEDGPIGHQLFFVKPPGPSPEELAEFWLTPSQRESAKRELQESRQADDNAALGRKMRRGGKPGRRRQALHRLLEHLFAQRELTADEIFNVLHDLAKLPPEHPVIKAVLTSHRAQRACSTLKCAENYHVHWMTDGKKLRTTGFASLRNILSRIRTTHR